jgi:hypothetical protein
LEEKMKTKHFFNAVMAARIVVIFLVLAGCGTTGATTPDGKPDPAAAEQLAVKDPALTWTAIAQSEIIHDIESIAYGGGTFVAGWRTGGGTGEMVYSADGITWTRVTDSVAGEQENHIVYAGGKFFTSGYPGDIAYSADGITWTRLADDQFSRNRSDIYGPVYADGKFVIMTYNGQIAYSADGVTWTRLAKSGLYSIKDRGVGYAGDKLFALWGDDSRLSYSADDGVTWTRGASFSNNWINAPIYGGGKFVAGGRGIVYSADGITWTAVDDTIFGGSGIQSIVYGGGKFVAGGDGGKMAYSTDGVTWTAIEDNTFDGSRIYAIAYGGGRFVAVGDDGKIAYSNMQE